MVRSGAGACKRRSATALVRFYFCACFWLGFRLFLAAGGRFLPGQVLLVTALEIRFVPAAALEAETGGRDLFLQARFPATGAIGEWRFTQFLQFLQRVATGPTGIFINWHNAPHNDIQVRPIGCGLFTGNSSHKYRTVTDFAAGFRSI